MSRICQEMIVYNVLHKRKVFLDAFVEGLELFHIGSAIRAFPSLFEELFVASGSCCPADVLSILNFKDSKKSDSRVARLLKSTILKFDESGMW